MIQRRALLLGMIAALLVALPVGSQQPRPSGRPTVRPSSSPPANAAPAPGPRLVPIADSKLLMEGMTNANYLGLEKILKSNAIDEDSWGFARGQTILIAESGNLLMIRPPNNPNQDVWMKAATEMRDSASQLAKVVATHDVAQSRAGLIELSRKCNACHEAFRVKTRVKPFDAGTP